MRVVDDAETARRSMKSDVTVGGGNTSMGVEVGARAGDGSSSGGTVGASVEVGGAGSGSSGGAVEAGVQVATQITVPGVSLPVNFNVLRCFSLPRAAAKAGRDVQVWWHGLTGGSNSGKQQAGAACKQLQFFANPACKGKALDEVLKPQFANLRRFFNVPRWVVRATWQPGR
ncbi:unnamed protein product [Closterium sp. Yama58-4]|nr:unnamed protein product [Closterium sp. Yama58-4]